MSGADIVRKEPAYIVWCLAAGVAEVDSQIKNLIVDWIDKNESQSEKAIQSAKRAGKGEFANTHQLKAAITKTIYNPAATERISEKGTASTSHSDWGSW